MIADKWFDNEIIKTMTKGVSDVKMFNELYTPVVLITYIRFDTTVKVFEQIKKVRPAKFYHISDAAYDIDKQVMVKKIRDYIASNIDWDCEFFSEYASENLGCKKRVCSGLEWVFQHEDRAIILEDDVVPSKDFFFFCQDLLEYYKNDNRVMMITGHKRAPEYYIESHYTFSNYCSIWGWATWKRAWDKNDPDMTQWPALKKNKVLKKIYGQDVALRLTREIDMVYKGELNSWAYPWQLSKIVHGGVEIVPSDNLIQNIGMGGEDATHSFDKDFDIPIGTINQPIMFLDDVQVDTQYDMAIACKEFKIGIMEKIIRSLVPQSILTNGRHFIEKINRFYTDRKH